VLSTHGAVAVSFFRTWASVGAGAGPEAPADAAQPTTTNAEATTIEVAVRNEALGR